MKNIVKLSLILALLISALLTGCKDPGNPNPGLPVLTGTVSITGTAQIGQTLTANTGSLGGSGTITYQWKRSGTNVGSGSNTLLFIP